MAISLKQYEHHNLTMRDGVLVVRDAYVSLSSDFSSVVSAIGYTEQTTECIACFSVSQINTSQMLHYLFFRTTNTKSVCLAICNEQFLLMCKTDLGTIPDKEPIISCATQNQQIVINSESFGKPFWGFIGGSVVPLVKVENLDPDDPAIEAPNGICCSFGDRVAIASGNVVYFSSPDFALRTYTGQNSFPMPGGGKIFDMFQGSDGNLYIFCSNGVYFFTRDALDTGVVFGSIGNIKGYEASSNRCAVQVGGAIFAPDSNQMAVLTNGSVSSFDIIKYKTKRYISKYVGNKGDLRKGKMFATTKGWIFVVNGKIAVFDKEAGHLSWNYTNDESALNIVGVLTDSDGINIYVHETGFVLPFGTRDDYTPYTGDTVLGCVCVSIPGEPSDSNVVRFITTLSDNVGSSQAAVIGGQFGGANTPAGDDQENKVNGNGSNWNGVSYSAREVASRRHGMNYRTDNVDFEVMVVGSGCKIEVASIEMKGQGRHRSSN